jgi:peptide-methionine (R)-S-oxide reductase
MEPHELHDDHLKSKLSPEEYRVLRERGTEAPFTGEYVDKKGDGVYRCKVCGNVLFSTENQVDSRESGPGLQGWPSFTDPAVSENIGLRDDFAFGMVRTEVYCKHCDSHLGHVFDEQVKGQERKHYCINSVCLAFEEDGK